MQDKVQRSLDTAEALSKSLFSNNDIHTEPVAAIQVGWAPGTILIGGKLCQAAFRDTQASCGDAVCTKSFNFRRQVVPGED